MVASSQFTNFPSRQILWWLSALSICSSGCQTFAAAGFRVGHEGHEEKAEAHKGTLRSSTFQPVRTCIEFKENSGTACEASPFFPAVPPNQLARGLNAPSGCR